VLRELVLNNVFYLTFSHILVGVRFMEAAKSHVVKILYKYIWQAHYKWVVHES
jgi:hypothetical protein